MTTLQDGRLMRRSAVAALLAVSERTVRRWGATGRLDECHGQTATRSAPP